MKLRSGTLLGILLGGMLAAESEAVFWKRRSSNQKETTSQAEAASAVPGDRSQEQPVSEPDRSPPSAGAGVATPGGGEEAAVYRREHLRIEDEDSVGVLRQLAQARVLREEEIRVLGRLTQEKDAELKRMNDQLLARFGIKADDNYQYEQESRSLFRIEPKTDAAQNAASGGARTADELFDRGLHLRFDSESDELEFIRLVSAKKITVSELAMLRLLLREKGLELERVLASLRDRFSIEPDKHYEYDEATRTLMEVRWDSASADR